MSPHPTPSPAWARPAAVDPEAHLDWAAGIARGVARCYHLRGQEAQDLVQTAYLTLLRACRAFEAERVPDGGDVEGALRGYCHLDIQSECRREAKRLRNGGTYRTRRREGELPPVLVDPLSGLKRDDGTGYEVEDGRGAGADADLVLPGTVRKRDVAGGDGDAGGDDPAGDDCAVVWCDGADGPARAGEPSLCPRCWSRRRTARAATPRG